MPRGDLYGISLHSASPSRGLPPPPKSDRLTSGNFRNSNAKARPLPHRNVRTGRAKAPQNVKEAPLELPGYTKDSINQARPGIKQRGSFSLLGSITGATKVAVHGPSYSAAPPCMRRECAADQHLRGWWQHLPTRRHRGHRRSSRTASTKSGPGEQ